METYFQGFHEDEQFSANLLLSDIDEVMKDQLVSLERFKMEETWGEESKETENVIDREDFQQIMSDWQQHLGSLHSTYNEELGLSLDSNIDILNNCSNCDLFKEVEGPILSKALKCPGQKHNINIQPLAKTLASTIGKDSFLDNSNICNKSHYCQKLCGLVKTEPNIIRKVTLINGEKEILGKNIVGLHCLNEIKENPDENCQVTSTVINGKRYKIIIKPKSLRLKKLSDEKIRKTLMKKLTQCHLVPKRESEDQIISETYNDNLDVPVINRDLLPTWNFAALGFECSHQGKNAVNTAIKETERETAKKVVPVSINLSKIKKSKKKWSVKINEITEAEAVNVNDKVVEGCTLNTLLKNFEEEVAKLEKNDDETINGKNNEQQSNMTLESIKNCLPREIINKIEALNRKKQCRIPLIQAMPTKKPVKNGTRMQDAVATMNRNKLLKIVSAGDSVQLDHDYCSISKSSTTSKEVKKSTSFETNLAEKNPKKDSGMESGDVSDASEGPNVPECLKNVQSFRQVNNKLLEEHRRVRNHSSVAKAAIAFFRATNAATITGSTSSSDSLKTKTVSNGNKALTNSDDKSDGHSYNINNNSIVCNGANIKDISSVNVDIENPIERCSPVKSERPRKKLKLEEYLSRRHLKEKEREKITKPSDVAETGSNNDMIKSDNSNGMKKSKMTESYCENTQEKSRESQCYSGRNKTKKENKHKKFCRSQSHRSSSGSSRERRRKSRSKSISRWRRSSSNCSSGGRREGREKQKYRNSESRERKNLRRLWSGSLSQSSSRESSTSSDISADSYCRNSSTRCRRRSRSRSLPRGRSSTGNRGCSRSRPGNFYYRNFNCMRTKSPFYAYSRREKQRQIEERRVIYVGRIEEGMTNAKLRERFSIFGPIIDISLHFREYGDNYGFVTYAYKADAYDAVEHGNDDPSLPYYDLCFGGRRGFCKEKYADLDGMPTSYSGFNDTFCTQNSKDSFDLLLKEAQAKLKNRKEQ